MDLKNTKFCQSCGMPMLPGIAYGTEADGSLSGDYCSYCYGNGAFLGEMSMEEKNEVIRRDPTYGKIICRCETVTEGEILAAIRTNPKPTDLDGVKRRTRAQMGRCQGGFCSPYIVELLAREQGIPYEAVTKCGGKSLVNIGRTKEVK